MNKEKIKKKILKWLKSEPSDFDFEEALKEYKNRKDLIASNFILTSDNKKDLISDVNNYYSQRQMALATKNLTNATWVLAAATIIFTLSGLIGPQPTLKILGSILVPLLWIFAGIFAFFMLSEILKAIIKLGIKLFAQKSK